MRTFNLGLGQCGRYATYEMYKQMRYPRYAPIFNQFDFFASDLEKADYKKDLLKMGMNPKIAELPSTEEEKSNKKLKCIPHYSMGPKLSGGVGGLWFVSKDESERSYKEFHKRFRFFYVSWIYNFIHSGGGGTGCGSGPTFLDMTYDKVRETFKEIEIKFEETLFLSTLVLPFEGESAGYPITESNSAAAIGRYTESKAHGILLVNNSTVDKIRKRDKLDYPSKEIANRCISQLWIWLTSISTNSPPILTNEPKSFETADLRKLIYTGERPGIIIPCYKEYPLDYLTEGPFTLYGLIAKTLQDYQLTECRVETFKRILVIVVIPRRFKEKLQSVLPEFHEIGSWLNETFSHEDHFISYVYHDTPTNSLKIVAFLIDPYVPIFIDYYNKFERIITSTNDLDHMIMKASPRVSKNELQMFIDEGRKEYHNAFDKYEKFLKKEKYEIEEI